MFQFNWWGYKSRVYLTKLELQGTARHWWADYQTISDLLGCLGMTMELKPLTHKSYTPVFLQRTCPKNAAAWAGVLPCFCPISETWLQNETLLLHLYKHLCMPTCTSLALFEGILQRLLLQCTVNDWQLAVVYLLIHHKMESCRVHLMQWSPPTTKTSFPSTLVSL